MKTAPFLVAAAVVSLAAGLARAEDPTSPKALVAKLLAAKTAAERKAAIDEIVAAKPDAEAVAAALAAGRSYAADAPSGWLEKTIVAPDGRVRPYLLHVPAKRDPAKRLRMVVDLHGGVSRPEHLSYEDLEEMKFGWGDEAEKSGWILALPTGQTGAVWWDAVGSGMVLDIVRETKRAYDVDDDAVFATGFSDGGSGSWFLGVAHPTPFAGFIPLNGHVSVAGASGTQIHLRNLMNRPVYAVNTDLDSLYPSAGLKPIMDAVTALGAPLVWRDIAGFRHEPTYLATERPAIVEWMNGARRDPAPKVIWWEGADRSPSRVDWLRVTKVAGGSGKEPFPDVNPKLTETRVRIGVMIDQAFAGPGVRVESAAQGSVAEEIGLAKGDVVDAIDGSLVKDFAGLRRILGAKKFGDDVAVKWKRGAESMEKKATIPAAKSEPAFDRKSPWATIRAEAKGNRIEVSCLGIASFDVLLSPRLVDLSKPVDVIVNGKSAFSGVVQTDLRFLLEQWASDEDRSIVYRARLSVSGDAAR